MSFGDPGLLLDWSLTSTESSFCASEPRSRIFCSSLTRACYIYFRDSPSSTWASRAVTSVEKLCGRLPKRVTTWSSYVIGAPIAASWSDSSYIGLIKMVLNCGALHLYPKKSFFQKQLVSQRVSFKVAAESIPSVFWRLTGRHQVQLRCTNCQYQCRKRLLLTAIVTTALAVLELSTDWCSTIMSEGIRFDQTGSIFGLTHNCIYLVYRLWCHEVRAMSSQLTQLRVLGGVSMWTVMFHSPPQSACVRKWAAASYHSHLCLMSWHNNPKCTCGRSI